MQRGAAAIKKRATFGPFLCGDSLTAADIVFLYSYPMALSTARKVLNRDLSAALPGADQLIEFLRERDAVKTLDAENAAGMQAFREKYGLA